MVWCASKSADICRTTASNLQFSAPSLNYRGVADRFFQLTRLRIWVVLVLAVIGVQAAVPMHAPLERYEGSAFSSTTIDVALASARRSDVETPQAEPLPALPPVISRPFAPLRFAALYRAPRLPAQARAPPPRGHPARVPDSTAPPFA